MFLYLNCLHPPNLSAQFILLFFQKENDFQGKTVCIVNQLPGSANPDSGKTGFVASTCYFG